MKRECIFNKISNFIERKRSKRTPNVYDGIIIFFGMTFLIMFLVLLFVIFSIYTGIGFGGILFTFILENRGWILISIPVIVLMLIYFYNKFELKSTHFQWRKKAELKRRLERLKSE